MDKIEVVDLKEEHKADHKPVHDQKHSERKEHTEHKTEEHARPHAKFHHRVKVAITDNGMNPWMIASGILGVLLLIVAIIAFTGKGGAAEATGYAAKDNLVFLYSDGCTTVCDEMEPEVKNIVSENKMGFSRAKYFQSMQTPGYVLTYNNTVYIGPIMDKNTFIIGMCQATNKESICDEAKAAQDELEQVYKAEQAKKLAAIPKATKPEVELFIMSHCPYGTQMEKAALPAAELLGDKIDFKVRFVYYAMHGEVEVLEQLNQYCIQKEQQDKFIPYLECFLEAGNGPDCLKKAGIDTDDLDDCAEAADKEFDIMKNLNDQASWLSGRFPKFDIDKELNEEYGIQGSPGLVINGQQVQSNRDPQSVLDVICSSFENSPEECKQTLSTAAASPGFGSSAGSSGSTGSCG
jgi:hypothetical protein